MSDSNCEPCTPEELGEKLRRGDDFCLLDVRTPDELDCARFEECLHIPLNELPQRLEEIIHLRDKEIVAICHHGMRSEMARDYLASQGFGKVRNLDGGIDAYAAEVDPRIGRY